MFIESICNDTEVLQSNYRWAPAAVAAVAGGYTLRLG
jgi:hypothetical protein